ncbi:MAG: hypothetical protein IPL51_13055 [Candidatus Competibacteraceae bacterium]|nr:hypothetical protein [Candidatus Competibacteraceae bacterium]
MTGDAGTAIGLTGVVGTAIGLTGVVGTSGGGALGNCAPVAAPTSAACTMLIPPSDATIAAANKALLNKLRDLNDICHISFEKHPT